MVCGSVLTHSARGSTRGAFGAGTVVSTVVFLPSAGQPATNCPTGGTAGSADGHRRAETWGKPGCTESYDYFADPGFSRLWALKRAFF
ncbi:hypothetical protein GCM10010383_06260 [Streptomyces lomondensis]|uniref:Secreted protein n=1 Tax=Streptomyces lomondensis TaxID=68229 RepID=A0ABQ2WX12_9ACTN|nr:hypothetical protein GCM10010383_06260 [Streptomyces lomondensis]